MTVTALIAIGGNALVLDGEPGSMPRQQERAALFAEQVADLVTAGWTVVVSHGNGRPQVGFILRRGELVASLAAVEGLRGLPLWLAVADSRGGSRACSPSRQPPAPTAARCGCARAGG